MPGVIISNVSFPKYLEKEIIEKDKDCELILPFILKSVKQLESANVDFIVLPCNTLHSLLPTLRKKSRLKFLDLIEEVSKRINKDYEKIGILSTTKTRNSRLYDNLLGDIKIIYPNKEEQKEVSNIIIKIIRKKETIEDKEYFDNLTMKLKRQGAEIILLACTDLANLINNEYTIDSTQILIDSIIKEMRKT
ncbi:aspartate/glutamate racemase family protein [Candidatus Woesearchaeota archaeon]|nr:aspartate/glutamate racemase family protein [Candidatus Woesearchaeota archaeon]